MSIATITGIIYAIIVIAFLVLIIKEARARRVKIGAVHVIVALFWPGWAIWYLITLLLEKINANSL